MWWVPEQPIEPPDCWPRQRVLGSGGVGPMEADDSEKEDEENEQD